MLTIRTALLALAGLILPVLSGHASTAVNIPDPDAVDAAVRAELYRQFWAAEAN